MFVSYRDPSVRLTGRWDVTNDSYAETTTTGAYVEFAFTGKMALACFDIEGNRAPFLHLWIQLDGGDMIEAPIDAYLRVSAKEEGTHICRIIFKSTEEAYSRWYRPLHGKVSFRGYRADATAALPEDDRKTVEFVGDSITEGVLIDVNYCEGENDVYELGQMNRIYQDDVCATDAWQTAENLNLRPFFMGYGGVGCCGGGQGKVPPVGQAYPYNFDGSPVTRPSADLIVINHGANDQNKDEAFYVERYAELLTLIREMNPTSRIVSLSAFCGAHHEALGRTVAEFTEKTGDNVIFIDSFGWIPKDPLHPYRDGHNTVTEHLTALLKPVVESL